MGKETGIAKQVMEAPGYKLVTVDEHLGMWIVEGRWPDTDKWIVGARLHTRAEALYRKALAEEMHSSHQCAPKKLPEFRVRKLKPAGRVEGEIA